MIKAFQSTPTESIVRLLNSGSPVTGKVFSDMTVKYHKTGDAGAFATKTLVAEDWVELENGYYALLWSGTDMNTLGTFFYQVEEAGSDTVADTFTIEPQPITLQAQAEKCIVSGNVRDIAGEPGLGRAVTFRIAESPFSVGSSIVSGEPIQTVPDFAGNFSIALLRNAKIIVEIQRAGIRHQIDIPDQETANLIDLLPPIN